MESSDTVSQTSQGESREALSEVKTTSECNDEPQSRAESSTESGSKRKISPIRWDEVERINNERRDRERRVLVAKERIERLERPKTTSIFDRACYFLVKSINFENIEIAIEKCVWSTSRSNEGRFTRAFREHANVILFFSVCESSAFQGFARMASLPDRDIRVRWVLPGAMRQSNLSYPFKIEWIHSKDLSFHATLHLKNSWNENKPVKIGRDGQEIEPGCGRALCELFDSDQASDLNVILKNRRQNQDEGFDRRNHHQHQATHFENRRRDNNYDRPPRFDRHHRNERPDPATEAAMLYNQLQQSSNSQQQQQLLWASRLAMATAPGMLLPAQMAANPAAAALLAVNGLPSLMDLNSVSRSRARSPLGRRSSPISRRYRSRSRSSSLGRIEDLDYEEYLRRASKGISVFPIDSSSDALYDQKVEAFLRGIHQRSRSRSQSRSSRSSGRIQYRRRRSRSRSNRTKSPLHSRTIRKASPRRR